MWKATYGDNGIIRDDAHEPNRKGATSKLCLGKACRMDAAFYAPLPATCELPAVNPRLVRALAFTRLRERASLRWSFTAGRPTGILSAARGFRILSGHRHPIVRFRRFY
jgi:hypothetical protein